MYIRNRAIGSPPKAFSHTELFKLMNLAAIKEGIYNNKKFLILPMGKDQVDNFLRLRKYGIDNSLC